MEQLEVLVPDQQELKGLSFLLIDEEVGGTVDGVKVVVLVGVEVTVDCEYIEHVFVQDDQLVLDVGHLEDCLLYTSPSPRDQRGSRMPSSA